VRTLVLVGLAFCVGCASSNQAAECDRYVELASVMACVDPEIWSGSGCPTDEEIAARPGGFTTLAECVTFLESSCDPQAHAGCDCITDSHCSCSIALGPRRSACAPAPAP
jgi:hypothetical protein